MPSPLIISSGACGVAVRTTIDASGFVFARADLSPGLRLPNHAHQQACFLVVLHGKYAETVGGQSCTYRPFSMITKPPMQEHSNDQQAAGASCLVIEVSERRFSSLGPYATLFEQRTVVQSGTIGAFALRAAQELTAPDELTTLSLEGLALEMVAGASRLARTLTRRPNRRWLDDVRQMLDEPNVPPSLGEIAQVVGLHPVYIARAFRHHFGCTIGEYARRRRIEQAQAALSGSNEDLAEIAARLGFCDQSHFSKSLRRYTGMSPAQFRKGAA